MTKFEAAEFEIRLAKRGWRFDAGDGEFREGRQVVEPADVQAILPGMSLNDLAAWMDRQTERFMERRA